MGTALEFLGLVGTSLRFTAEENKCFLLEGGGDPERPCVLTPAACQLGVPPLPTAWPQAWAPPARRDVQSPSPDFLPLCPSLRKWRHGTRWTGHIPRPRHSRAVLRALDVGGGWAPRPGTRPQPGQGCDDSASRHDVHSLVKSARVLLLTGCWQPLLPPGSRTSLSPE